MKRMTQPFLFRRLKCTWIKAEVVEINGRFKQRDVPLIVQISGFKNNQRSAVWSSYCCENLRWLRFRSEQCVRCCVIVPKLLS